MPRDRDMTVSAQVLKQMMKPPVAVKNTMIAMLMLLGYERPIRQGQDWDLVLKVLSGRGENSISRRVDAFDVSTVTPEQAQYARAKIKPYSAEMVESAANAACVFFGWVESTLASCPPDPLPDTCK
ncbi:uncharacterized protein LOC101863993 [Aplysia californica]|uniref:Uncharacterized protein LOC101863993 n=1 Tax=Aplysia californica TaxID=6500 RepID=A0ABM0JV19_APLCA|nr:uncharacterized protein LOC101863993 [Aplysia californica]